MKNIDDIYRYGLLGKLYSVIYGRQSQFANVSDDTQTLFMLFYLPMSNNIIATS